MRVLTIDTATTAAAIGVVDGGHVVDGEPVREPAAAQHVLVAVDQVLERAGLAIGDVDCIAVGRGPGSFTGLRIGLATAAGLAACRAVRLCGVSTTAALRHAGGGETVAVVDARRGEVFAEGPGIPLAAYAPDALAGLTVAGATLIGDGAVRYRAQFAGCAIPADESPLHVPAAASLAALAQAGDPATPLYVRQPDAVPTEQRA